MNKKQYRKLMKGVTGTVAVGSTEAVGYGLLGNIANQMPAGAATTVGTNILKTSGSLAGMPTLVHGAGTVMGSLNMLTPRQRYKKRKR